MYFKKLELENVGPIEQVSLDFPFTKSGSPKPLVIVGENGTGKTILLSYLVNALILAKEHVFDNTEVKDGNVYKVLNPQYISAGKHYLYGRVEFEKEYHVEEWQLDLPRIKFEQTYGFRPSRESWNDISEDEALLSIGTPFEEGQDNAAAKDLFDGQCCLYFPVNRFEEPAWLNEEGLTERVNLTELKHVIRYSNRSLICTSPLKANRSWILDLMFDMYAKDRFKNVDQNVRYYQGSNANILFSIEQILKGILRTKDELRLDPGTRQDRRISIFKNKQLWIPDLFQLSTGEVSLLNLFLSILRDYDLSEGPFKSLNDVCGIVIIDEIDAHLHTVHQKEILPRLIALFPKVQFIITTHSPLFLLGMDAILGPDGFKIINMPAGERLLAEDFSEFMAAYEAFKQTKQHRQELSKLLKESAVPIVFFEGELDLRYVKRAAELLGKSAVLDAVRLKEASGFGNLDKIWSSYEPKLAELLPSNILLLYDCDQKKKTGTKGTLIRCTIPAQAGAQISEGIENLFPSELVERLQQTDKKFIDVDGPRLKIERGIETVLEGKKSINKDEKKNVCDWLCENGTAADFRNFAEIFDIIEKELLPPTSGPCLPAAPHSSNDAEAPPQ